MTKKPEAAKKPTKKQLAAQLKAMDVVAVKKCAEAVNEVLEHHGCVLVPEPAFRTDGTIGATVGIRKKPEDE
jgi:hypothetical protein